MMVKIMETFMETLSLQISFFETSSKKTSMILSRFKNGCQKFPSKSYKTSQ